MQRPNLVPSRNIRNFLLPHKEIGAKAILGWPSIKVILERKYLSPSKIASVKIVSRDNLDVESRPIQRRTCQIFSKSIVYNTILKYSMLNWP